MMRRHVILTGLAILLSVGRGLLSPLDSVAQTPDQLLFGPQQYLRTSGAPNEYTNTFTVPVSVGAPFQLHIVNGEANGQSRISSAWIKVNGVQVAGPSDFNQTVAVVDKTITLNPGNNTLYVKVASTAGAYLTISVFGTAVLPTPASLTPNPLNLTVGATGTLTAALSPAPTTAGTLSVSSGNTSVATVPASVNFGINQASVPIPVTAVGAGQAQITVSLNGGTASTTVQVNPAVPTIAGVQPPTLTVTQGASGTLTVSINAVQSTLTTVTLTSSAPGVASVPGTVEIPIGQISAPITVSANTPGDAVITASLNGTIASSIVTVTPAPPTIASLQPPTLPITLGASGTLTVTVSATQPTDTAINVTASPGGIVTVPATVTVLAGQLSASIPVGTVALGSAMVQASLNGTSAESAVSVVPPVPAVTALQPPISSVVVGATGQLTVTLNAAQLINTDVTLTVDQPAILQVPPTVTVPANQTQAVFTVTGLVVGDAVVTAAIGSSSKTALVHVIPPPPVPVSLLPNPLPLQQGATGTLTLTINAAQLSDTIVPLTNSDTNIIQIPANVTVPAGQLTATVPVTALLAGTATVSATLNSVTVSSTVQVSPPPPVVSSLTPATLSLPKGKPGTLRVTISRASIQVEGVTVTSSATGVVQAPTMVPVPAGALFADFPVLSLSEGTATITATLNGGSATSTVSVTPAEVVTLTLSPLDAAIFVGETQPFTATGTYTDGTTQNLTSTVTWTSEAETVATIDTGGLATALAVGTTTITASITNPSGSPPVTAGTTLTVQTPPLMQLIPDTATLQIGENVSLTLNVGAPAGANGLTVTFTQSGTGSVTVPSTVTLLVGEVSLPIVVTGATLGSVTLTASATGRLSATATLTVNPGVPSITSFSPLTGPIGTTVTITGTSFNPVAANNQVKFNGTTAIITSVNGTGTQLVTTVPQSATTGPITVTTAMGTGTSAQNFTVTGPDFTISALPAPLAIASTGQSAFAVSLNGTGGFTNLATLSVTGMPSGMTATFSAATLTMGQSAFLTVITNGTTAAGVYPLTINAVGLVNGVQTTRSATANVQVLAAGITSLIGQVQDEDAKPVKNALVKLGVLQVSTDDGGNFLLQNPPVGVDQLLFIDGGPASTPEHNLPIIPYKVTIVAGQTNLLSFVPKLHFQKTTGLVDISNSAVERVVTDAEIPGFEMKIPAGATIIGWDGQPNTKISVRRVPIDRLPLPPLPQDGLATGSVYMDYFDKPGGGTPSEPIPITFPNDLGLPPGTQVELWYFDEAPDGSRPNQWAQFGTGTISADGNQVVPDINPATGKPYGQPQFCCGAAAVRARQALLSQVGGGSPTGHDPDADPVDLATGQFTLDKTDMVLPGRVPITFTRTYRSGGASGGGPFGPRTSHSYQILIIIEGNLRTLILPGKRIAFTPQPGGTFTNATEPAFRGAVLTGNTLRFKDGAVWAFNAAVLNTLFLTSQTDRNGNTLTLTRSGPLASLTAITEPSGRQFTLTYTDLNQLSQISDPLGRTVNYTYDGNGNLNSVTDPEGGLTRYTYDSESRLLTITDPRQIQYIQNFYGASGRVLRQVMADGGEWRLRYEVVGATVTGTSCIASGATGVVLPATLCPTEDSWENLQAGYTMTNGTVTATTVVDPQGQAKTMRFNGARYRNDAVDAAGQKTVSVRDAGNQVTASTDPLGRTTKYEYDAAGNVTKITDPNNQITRFEYEPTFNRVTKITDALNQVTEFTYDATGNLLTTKDPLNHVTTIAYNAFGQPTSVQGPIPTEPPTTFAYDAQGNLQTTTDPLGNVTQRAYDTVGRLLNLTDPRGLSTLFRYDGLNRVTEIADAAQGLTRFIYDPNGNLLTVQDAKNQTTTYTYDSMDRLATRKDALNRQETYQYDPAGNLTQFTDRKNQQTTFGYDSLNRRTGASYQDGSSTSFIYDSVGRLARATDSVAGAIEFGYDTLDRLMQETTPQGTVTYQYDALGRRSQMTANGQQAVTYGYDAASRLTQVAQGTQIVGLGYDNANRRTSLTYPNGTSTAYIYDNASRLTNIVHNGPSGLIESLSYVYDAAGNRISLTRTNGAASNLPAAVQAAYDAANQQIQFNAGSSNQTFDANGNLTSQADASGTTTFTYNARNQIISINGPGLSASFTYDVLGRRITKTVNGVTTVYQYDRRDIIAEISGSAVVANYLRKLCLDEAFVRQSSSGNEYYHNDALQSVLVLSDATGIAGTSYTYEPFGKTSVTGSSTNPFQFTGRENDGLGLYYYRARYFSSSRQRFLREDPIRFRGGFNFYAYVGNNPILFTDPLGFEKQQPRMCELSQGGVRIMIPCTDDGKVPPNIVPGPTEVCTLTQPCYNNCLEEFAQILGACKLCIVTLGDAPICQRICQAVIAGVAVAVCRESCERCEMY